VVSQWPGTGPALARLTIDIVTSDDALMTARALVLRDLEATRAANPESVSALEEAVITRRWWASQWEEGREYVAGLLAQDVQDAILDKFGRWPLCRVCEDRVDPEDPHALYIHPELGGPDPTWVCEQSGISVAALGALPG
jgi:hypothetical protein